MKKLVLVFGLFCLMSFHGYSQTIYMTQGGFISFFSTTPLEDIEAKNNSVKGIFNTMSKELHIIVPIRQFKFPKALMEEHFNENYLESDKYPNSTYDGTINEKIDFSKDGTYAVTSTGKLMLHGVEQERTDKGTLTIKGNEIRLVTEMTFKVADYKIQIPKVVGQNIAETVLVKLNIPFTPYKKIDK